MLEILCTNDRQFVEWENHIHECVKVFYSIDLIGLLINSALKSYDDGGTNEFFFLHPQYRLHRLDVYFFQLT